MVFYFYKHHTRKFMGFADELKEESRKIIEEEKRVKFVGLNSIQYAEKIVTIIKDKCKQPWNLKKRKIEIFSQGLYRDYDWPDVLHLNEIQLEDKSFLATGSIPAKILKKITGSRFLITDRVFGVEVANRVYEILSQCGFDKLEVLLIENQDVYQQNNRLTPLGYIMRYTMTGEKCCFFYINIEW